MWTNRTVNGLKLIFYLSFLIEITSIYRYKVFANDMLIIRHGRSRVRHSSEKKFIRWGLHAFDNLTLFDYDYDSINGTNGSNETFLDATYGASNTNQTYFGIGGNDGLGYYSTEFINANTNTNNNNNPNNKNNLNSHTNDENESTLAPVSMAISQNHLSPSAQSLDAPSPPISKNNNKKQQRGKKKIMASIRKTVEEGIVYLRQHATRHSRPTPNIPLHQLEKQSMSNRNDEEPGSSSNFNMNDDGNGNANEGADIDTKVEKPFTLDENGALISEHLISPSNQHQQQQPFNHFRNQHNQSNPKRMKNEKPPKQRTKIKRPTQQRKHPQKQRLHLDHQHDDGKHENGNGDGDEFMDSNESNEMLSHIERIYFDFDVENDDDGSEVTELQLPDANPSIVINSKKSTHNQPLIDLKFDNDALKKHSPKIKRKNKNRRETTKTIDRNNNNESMAILNAATISRTSSTAISAIDATVKNVKHQLNNNNVGNGGVDGNYFRTSKKLTNKTMPKHLQFDMRQQLRVKQYLNAATAVANEKDIKSKQPTIVSQTGDNQSSATKQQQHQQYNDSSVRSIAKFHTKNTDRNNNNQFELKGGSSSHSHSYNSNIDSDNDDNDMANDESNDDNQIASDDNDSNNDGDTDIDDDRNTLSFGSNFDDDDDDDKSDAMQYRTIGPGFRMEDFDLDELDETSRNNRLNLMKGQDVVTNFLQIVEYQHLLGANCTAGTALNLGEGVVDRYAQDRFRVEAEVAVNRANMLTR